MFAPRIRRFVSPQYPWTKNSLDEDIYAGKFDNNNRLESLYEGLKAEDDTLWNNVDDTEGIWMDSIAKPHFEQAQEGGSRREPLVFDNALKNIKSRQNSDQSYDFKNYFKY